jgi:hypothetical protein
VLVLGTPCGTHRKPAPAVTAGPAGSRWAPPATVILVSPRSSSVGLAGFWRPSSRPPVIRECGMPGKPHLRWPPNRRIRTTISSCLAGRTGRRSGRPAGTQFGFHAPDLPSPSAGQQGEQCSDGKLSSRPDEHIVLRLCRVSREFHIVWGEGRYRCHAPTRKVGPVQSTGRRSVVRARRLLRWMYRTGMSVFADDCAGRSLTNSRRHERAV